MKRYWSGLFVAGALAATAALGAQAQNPANTPPPDNAAQPGTQRTPAPPSAQTRADNTVTVTGCVQNAPMASAPGASATPPGQANRSGSQTGQRFVLSNGTMASTGASGRSAVGTTGTGMTTYQLDGQTADLSTHVNHRVEITGTLQNSSASSTGSANAAAGATAAGPTLRVTSVRMLSMTCDAAKTPGTTGSTIPGPTGSSTSPGGGASPSGGNPADVPSEPRPREDAPAPRPQP
jgi:hypothetical protein